MTARRGCTPSNNEGARCAPRAIDKLLAIQLGDTVAIRELIKQQKECGQPLRERDFRAYLEANMSTGYIQACEEIWSAKGTSNYWTHFKPMMMGVLSAAVGDWCVRKRKTSFNYYDLQMKCKCGTAHCPPDIVFANDTLQLTDEEERDAQYQFGLCNICWYTMVSFGKPIADCDCSPYACQEHPECRFHKYTEDEVLEYVNENRLNAVRNQPGYMYYGVGFFFNDAPHGLWYRTIWSDNEDDDDDDYTTVIEEYNNGVLVKRYQRK